MEKTIADENIVPANDQETRRLEQLKLKAEISAISRSPWISPALLIPLAATLITLGYSQWVGIFDLKRDQYKLENEKVLFANTQLAVAKEKLRIDIDKLSNDRSSLEGERAGLIQEKAKIQVELESLKNIAREANEKAQFAIRAQAKALQDFDIAYQAAKFSHKKLFYASIGKCDDMHGNGYLSASTSGDRNVVGRVRASLMKLGADIENPQGFVPQTGWHLQDANALKDGADIASCLVAARDESLRSSPLNERDLIEFKSASRKLTSGVSESYIETRTAIYRVCENAVLRPDSFAAPTADQKSQLPIFTFRRNVSQQFWAEYVATTQIDILIKNSANQFRIQLRH